MRPTTSQKPLTVSGSKSTSLHHSLYAFWKFSRPHTVIGTSLSVIGLYLLAVAELHLPLWHGVLAHFASIGVTLLACLCGNIYIVGLNQLEDVAIDCINKPHLPLAAGEFSQRQGQMIVWTTGALALLLAATQDWYLFGMVGLSLAIGTAYSLPPIRLKRFPFWASACIFTVRGVIVNLGLFLHFRHQLEGGTTIPLSVWVLTAFILGFTLAIALLKDIPDMLGDRQYNIRTFTLRLGAKSVFQFSRWLLTLCYLGMIVMGGLGLVSGYLLLLAHLLILAGLWWRSLRVNLQDKVEVSQFYQFVWKLFFLEYLVFPLLCMVS